MLRSSSAISHSQNTLTSSKIHGGGEGERELHDTWLLEGKSSAQQFCLKYFRPKYFPEMILLTCPFFLLKIPDSGNPTAHSRQQAGGKPEELNAEASLLQATRNILCFCICTISPLSNYVMRIIFHYDTITVRNYYQVLLLRSKTTSSKKQHSPFKAPEIYTQRTLTPIPCRNG